MFLNTNYPKVDPQLHKAAKLVFKFPKPDGSGDTWTRSCPFFENPMIKENKSANLVKYNPIGRSSTLLGYSGAKSRSFSISFDLTLPHLLFLSQGFPENTAPSDITKEEQKNMFFVKNTAADSESLRGGNRQYGFQAQAKEFFNNMSDDEKAALQNVFPNNTAFPGIDGLPGGATPVTADPTYRSKKYRDAVMMVVYWTNLIRSSVLTYAPNPSVGPPIVYFSFGILYERVPTVAEKYSITVDEKAGYDVLTLLPNKLKFSLNLLEVRANAGTSFETGDQIHSVDLVGWEGILGREKAGVAVDSERPIFGGFL